MATSIRDWRCPTCGSPAGAIEVPARRPPCEFVVECVVGHRTDELWSGRLEIPDATQWFEAPEYGLGGGVRIELAGSCGAPLEAALRRAAHATRDP